MQRRRIQLTVSLPTVQILKNKTTILVVLILWIEKKKIVVENRLLSNAALANVHPNNYIMQNAIRIR